MDLFIGGRQLMSRIKLYGHRECAEEKSYYLRLLVLVNYCLPSTVLL